MKPGVLLLIALGLPSCSDAAPAKSYRIVGTVISYVGGVHAQAGASPDCLTALAPDLRSASVQVTARPGGYTVREVGGCDLEVDLKDRALVATKKACKLDPNGQLAALGIVERFYDSFRLDLDSGEAQYKFRNGRRSGTREAIVNGCFVFAGTGMPEAEEQ